MSQSWKGTIWTRDVQTECRDEKRSAHGIHVRATPCWHGTRWRPPQSLKIQNKRRKRWLKNLYASQNAHFNRMRRASGEYKLACTKAMFIALLSAAMQSNIPGSCLGGDAGMKRSVTDMSRCLQCGVRADTLGFVSAAMCMTVFCVYRASALFISVCLCALLCVCIYRDWAPKVTCQDTDVRKLRHSKSDKQIMPGGGSKQYTTIALLLSVCPWCHVTLQHHKSPLWSSELCLCVLALAEAPLWLVILDMLKQSQTHNRSSKQLGPATVHNLSLNALCFPRAIYQSLHTPPQILSIKHEPPSTAQAYTHTHMGLRNILMFTLRSCGNNTVCV